MLIYDFSPSGIAVCGFADIQDIAVHKSELFCLHTNGKVVHLSLLLVDRCIERLMRRGFWTLAARVSCLFQNSIVSCRVSKYLFLNVQYNFTVFPVPLSTKFHGPWDSLC